ncbi:MAG: GNAT family N-acetyltransferase [Victivallaceae bacterium]|nr:GNAT family N-acetyltransferase [Victivallaceae bacterium]
MNLRMVSLRENPDRLEQFIGYFSSHWGHEAVYRDCMTACLHTASPLPQWYLLMDGETILGGCGLIVNDFNARQDLWPWLCALYVEENHRGHAYGSRLLRNAQEEAAKAGFQTLYLVTDHVGYYEKYNFEWIGMTSDPFGGSSRIYQATNPCGETAKQ